LLFITADNFLSKIDLMPLNDTWNFSTRRDEKRHTHKQSQLASVTQLNGTSAWIYYQDVNEQLREFGLDDYRGITWRDVVVKVKKISAVNGNRNGNISGRLSSQGA